MAVSTLKIVRTGPPSNYVAEPALAVSMRRRMPAYLLSADQSGWNRGQLRPFMRERGLFIFRRL